jgi:integrase
MKGIGLKAVQKLLGHADLTMTMRYAHLSQGPPSKRCSGAEQDRQWTPNGH